MFVTVATEPACTKEGRLCRPDHPQREPAQGGRGEACLPPLMFVGAKMLVSNVYHLPVWASLLFIAGVLATSVVASLRATRDPEEVPSDAMSR